MEQLRALPGTPQEEARLRERIVLDAAMMKESPTACPTSLPDYANQPEVAMGQRTVESGLCSRRRK